MVPEVIRKSRFFGKPRFYRMPTFLFIKCLLPFQYPAPSLYQDFQSIFTLKLSRVLLPISVSNSFVLFPEARSSFFACVAPVAQLAPGKA